MRRDIRQIASEGPILAGSAAVAGRQAREAPRLGGTGKGERASGPFEKNKILPKWVEGKARSLTGQHCGRCGIHTGAKGTCKACAEYIREWKANNKDRLRIHSNEQRARDSLVGKKYPRKSKRVILANGFARNDARPEYPTAKRLRNTIKRHRYRAKVKSAGGAGVTKKFVEKLLVMQKGICVYCRAHIVGGFHIDHILPLALGGAHDESNVQLLCPTCNVTKGALHPIDFAQRKGLLL